MLERDAENAYLAGDDLEAGPMEQLLGSSITYRIAVGPHQGRKVFTLQKLAACDDSFDDGVGKVARFSLHAGVAARAGQRQKLERLCRYISRPAIAEKRLSLTPNGNVRYQLKTPSRDGTTHVIIEPLDFIARLAALVPKPRVNLTRFHGVLAPNSQLRARVTRAKRGRGGQQATTADPQAPTSAERRAAMTWAQRLRRVFGIDIATCPACGRAVQFQRLAAVRLGRSPQNATSSVAWRSYPATAREGCPPRIVQIAALAHAVPTRWWCHQPDTCNPVRFSS